MRYVEINRVLSRFFLYFSAILLIPLSVSILYDFFLEKELCLPLPATWAFLNTLGITLLLYVVFSYVGKKATGSLYRKESILIVALIWFISAAIAALPFYFTKVMTNPIDAYFESMSGLTTTGATIIQPKAYHPSTGEEIPVVLHNPIEPSIVYTFYGTVSPLLDTLSGKIVREGTEALGKPLLFWRCFLQWLGGMGIVVLFIAVLPALAMGGRFLYETEITGPSKEAVTPRIKETASFLWKVYLGLTLLQVTTLIFFNPQMPIFDAINLSFSTISTGGFAVRNQGLLSYNHNQTEWIIAIFMFLGSLNFTLYFHCLKGKIYRLYEPEFFLYLLILGGSCLLMTWNLWDTPKFFFEHKSGSFSFIEALKLGSFQAISAQTSTGFSLANYDLWPFSCQLLMIILMFIGGMSGSTTGGIKVVRYVIMLRLIKNKIISLFRPEHVKCVKIGEKEISDKTGMTVLVFFCIVISLVAIGSYLLVLDNNDPQTSFSVISCMMNNTGLPFGGAGYTGSFAFLSNFSKLISIFWMALGRLEYFTLLVLIIPAFWKKR